MAVPDDFRHRRRCQLRHPGQCPSARVEVAYASKHSLSFSYSQQICRQGLRCRWLSRRCGKRSKVQKGCCQPAKVDPRQRPPDLPRATPAQNRLQVAIGLRLVGQDLLILLTMVTMYNDLASPGSMSVSLLDYALVYHRSWSVLPVHIRTGISTETETSFSGCDHMYECAERVLYFSLLFKHGCVYLQHPSALSRRIRTLSCSAVLLTRACRARHTEQRLRENFRATQNLHCLGGAKQAESRRRASRLVSTATVITLSSTCELI